MSTSDALQSPEREQHPARVLARHPEDDLRALDETPCWPVTRLAGWSLMLLLAACISGPTVAREAGSLDWPMFLLPAFMATLGARALFETFGVSTRSPRVARHVLAALPPALLAALVMAGASVVRGDRFSALVAITTAMLTVATLTTARAVRDVEIRVRLSLRRVFFVGTQESHRDLARELSRRRDARLVGAFAVGRPAGAAALMETVRTTKASVLVLDAHAMRSPDLVEAASQLNLGGLHVRDLVSYYESEFKKIPLAEIAPAWFLFDMAPIHHRGLYRAVRRGVEMAIAGGFLLASLPVLAALALAIKTTSSGPVLYRQRRVGRGGVQFTLFKLRTMVPDPAGAAEWAPAAVHRITPLGRLLRRFRLDELPQLWNVITGDLALIGPRPEQVPIADRLARELPHYAARHCIRPGLTGWAQVNLGYAGSPEGAVAKLQRDLFYVKHSSLRLDVLILWLTIKAVIAGRGE